jgi:hypothetical protein
VGGTLPETITLRGYLNGVLVGTDTFSKPAGVTLDSLQIALPNSIVNSLRDTAAIDNVVLNTASVPATAPEPGSLIILGAGLQAVTGTLRRHLR